MIDPNLAAFLEEGLGIHLGTRNARLEPNGVRAIAALVEPGGTHIVAYVPDAAATRVLPDLESNGQTALVFGRPRDHRSCQVKGEFVEARPGEPGEREAVRAQFARFRENLAEIGIPREGSARWATWPVVAVRVRVTALFEQTPGPSAGNQLA
jgi:hypothetical protein